MAWKNYRSLQTVQCFKGIASRATYWALIGGTALFISLCVVGIPSFDQNFFGTTSRPASEGKTHSPYEGRFSHVHDFDWEKQALDYENVLRTSGNITDFPATILAAGDIAKCDGEDPWTKEFLQLVRVFPDDGPTEPFLENLLELLSLSEETDYPANAAMTAELVLRLPGRVLALGDLVYPTGTTQQFQECYESTWGQFKARTHPVPGNHEYKEQDAAPYFTYWGKQAGEMGKGYYSFDLGQWHIIALNSKIEKKQHEKTISAQHAWLQEDLKATKAGCILAYWHHPVFSSGQQRGIPRMKNMLQTLYTFGVTVVLTGHAHNYERFALQDPEGMREPSRGFRQFVVGTGGVPLRPLKERHENSEVFQADSYGILRLDLYPNSYSWQFLPVGEEQLYDVGTGACVTPSRPVPHLEHT